MLVLLLWVVNVTWFAQLAGWGGELIGWSPELLNGPSMAALIQAGLLFVPLLLASWLWRMARYRAMSQMWLGAAGLGLLLALTRLWPSTQSQLVLLAQLVLVVAYGLFLKRQLPKSNEENPYSDRRYGLSLALILSAVLALPWLLTGSVGSVLDLLLNLGLGVGAGWVTNLLLNRLWLRSLMVDSRGMGRDSLTGGFVVGTMMLILASGLSLNGIQLLLMLALSAAGWLVVAVADSPLFHFGKNSAGGGWLVGLLAAAILIFTDTDAAILQAQDGLLGGYLWAAGVGAAGALLLGIAAILLRYRLPYWNRYATLLLVGILCWLSGALVYHLSGQSGFHGDRLFVVMASQADVSAAADSTDYDARRRSVYDTLVTHADESQADLRASLDRFGIAYTPYYLVNALEIEGGLLIRLWLSTRSDIDRVMPSPTLRPLTDIPETAVGIALSPAEPQWNLTNIGADRVWADFRVTGAGITIGQSDSGVQHDHPELADSYRGQEGNHDYSWFDPWGDSTVPSDVSGHGTHTLGSVLGNSVGVAPDAEWIGCANLYRNLGNPAFYLDCMQFMLAPFPVGGDPFADGDPTRSAHVLNNSWGCPEDYEGCDPESLRPAVAALRAAGIFVVASAGNSGPNCSTISDSIATYDEVFSVGAVNRQNDLALFSSVGPVVADGSGRIKPDIVAPGVDVLSAYPNGSYEEASGTSMAGPHVAGVVALIWSANPALIGDIDRTEQILIESAQPFEGTLDMMLPDEVAELANDEDAPAFFDRFLSPEIPAGACIRDFDLTVIPNNIVGFGVVDAYGAVEMAMSE